MILYITSKKIYKVILNLNLIILYDNNYMYKGPADSGKVKYNKFIRYKII